MIMQTGETTPTEENEDNATTSTTLTNNVKDSLVAANEVGVLTGIIVTSSVALLGVIAVVVCLATVVVKKRKITIRSLQLEMLAR